MYRIHFDQVRDYAAIEQSEQTSAEWAKLAKLPLSLGDKAVQTARSIFSKNEKSERGSTATKVAIGGAVLAVSLLGAKFIANGPAEIPAYEDNLTEYTVRSGDTLWEIADAFTSNEDDMRNAYEQIKVTNGLDSSAITPGQILYIPDLNIEK